MPTNTEKSPMYIHTYRRVDFARRLNAIRLAINLFMTFQTYTAYACSDWTSCTVSDMYIYIQNDYRYICMCTYIHRPEGLQMTMAATWAQRLLTRHLRWVIPFSVGHYPYVGQLGRWKGNIRTDVRIISRYSRPLFGQSTCYALGCVIKLCVRFFAAAKQHE